MSESRFYTVGTKGLELKAHHRFLLMPPFATQGFFSWVSHSCSLKLSLWMMAPQGVITGLYEIVHKALTSVAGPCKPQGELWALWAGTQGTRSNDRIQWCLLTPWPMCSRREQEKWVRPPWSGSFCFLSTSQLSSLWPLPPLGFNLLWHLRCLPPTVTLPCSVWPFLLAFSVTPLEALMFLLWGIWHYQPTSPNWTHTVPSGSRHPVLILTVQDFPVSTPLSWVLIRFCQGYAVSDS